MDKKCLLYKSENEDINHLFVDCLSSRQIKADRVALMGNSIPRTSAQTITFREFFEALYWLLFQIAVWHVWRERYTRMH